ncbi:MAG TPA: hypothetical protein VHW00_18905 [Thermoanaerobaculia bacterium]|nr:hypothetical protein [Thermoanaerobaculia bacterium]
MADETEPIEEESREEPRDETPAPRWRPAAEPTCCGSGCLDCPF